MANLNLQAIQRRFSYLDSSSAMQRYVSVLALSEDFHDVVLLRKTKGPAHIIGKLTIPGGKVEESDTDLKTAAAREFREESGVEVDPASLFNVGIVSTPGEFELTVYACATDISKACTQPNEEEAITVMDLKNVMEALVNRDPEFVPDLAQFIDSADTHFHGKILQSVAKRPRP